MEPADDREEVLFREARQRPPGPEREAYLDQACAGNEALRSRLAALLQAHESPDPLDLDVLGAEGACFSPDGKLFAVASSIGYARVWETATWREVATLRGHLLGVHSATFSGDGKRLATGGGNAALKLWDTESWQEVLTLKGQGSLLRGTSGTHWQPTAFSPDGNAILAVNHARIVHIWWAPSWEEINTAEKSAPGLV